jgi:hypothetical protein
MANSAEDSESGAASGVKIYFNPFAFTIEANNEFLRRGYEPMPLRIPDTHIWRGAGEEVTDAE